MLSVRFFRSPVKPDGSHYNEAANETLGKFKGWCCWAREIAAAPSSLVATRNFPRPAAFSFSSAQSPDCIVVGQKP
jgi:hypothetical protein